MLVKLPASQQRNTPGVEEAGTYNVVKRGLVLVRVLSLAVQDDRKPLLIYSRGVGKQGPARQDDHNHDW